MIPDIGKKLSVFVALAPAVFAGPLTNGWLFRAVGRMEWTTWKKLFGPSSLLETASPLTCADSCRIDPSGVLDFIPTMRIAYDLVPGKPFAMIGYQMFAFLFRWTDANWLLRRKYKHFRFTPSPVSSAGVFWWAGAGGFASRGCIMDPYKERWFDERMPPVSLCEFSRDCVPLLWALLMITCRS